MRTAKLGVIEKIGFGAGDAAVNVVWSALNIIIVFFYTDIFGLTAVHAGWLMLIPRLIDAFADVAMGAYTDSHTTRWGRYRPYFLIGAVPFGLSIMLVFTTPDFSYAGKHIYAYATYILMMLVFTSVTIPYISLPAVLTADPQERLSANGYRLFFAKAASLAVNIFVPLYAKYYAERWGSDQVSKGYQIAMAVMAAMATFLFIFCFLTTTERVTHKSERKPLGQQLGLLFLNSQWMILAGVCLIGTMGYVLRGSLGFYYAKYFLGGDEKMQSAFVTAGIVGNILSMVASTWITKYYCKIKLFRWSQILTFVVSLIMCVAVRPGNVAAAFVLYFLINFIVDLQGPVFWSIISEAVDYGQVNSGKRVAGMAFGGISFCQKMGMSVAGGMAGWMLALFGYKEPINGVAQVQSALTLNGIAILLTIVPGIFHLIVAFLMFKYFITDKYYNENIRELVTHETANGAEESAVP